MTTILSNITLDALMTHCGATPIAVPLPGCRFPQVTHAHRKKSGIEPEQRGIKVEGCENLGEKSSQTLFRSFLFSSLFFIVWRGLHQEVRNE